MHTEYFFKPKALRESIVYPDQARVIAAKICDGIPIDPAIFHRNPDGSSIQGRGPDGEGLQPPIVFDGGKGFVRIYGFGQKGMNILSSQAGLLLSAFTKQYGPTALETRETKSEIRFDKGFREYSMRRLVVAKKNQDIDKFYRKPIHEVSELVANIIRRGMLSQARLMDVGQAPFYEGALPHDEAFPIHIHEGEPMPIDIKNGNYAAGYRDIVFSLPFTATGTWQAGLLRSRGFGLFRLIGPNRMRGAA